MRRHLILLRKAETSTCTLMLFYHLFILHCLLVLTVIKCGLGGADKRASHACRHKEAWSSKGRSPEDIWRPQGEGRIHTAGCDKVIAAPDLGGGSRKLTRKQKADEEPLQAPDQVGVAPQSINTGSKACNKYQVCRGYDPVRAGATGSNPAFPSAIAYSCQEPYRAACATLYLSYTEN